MVKPRRKRPLPASRFKGLAWDKSEGCWRVRVSLLGKQHHLGRHADEQYAAQVYDCAAYVLFGEDGAVNFGAQRAQEWLPRLEREDCPGLRAIQELKRQCDERPSPLRRPGQASNAATLADGDGGPLLRPRPAHQDGGAADSGGDDTGGGRDEDESGSAYTGGLIGIPGMHVSPRPVKRARAAGASRGSSGVANPGGVKLMAGLHSLPSGPGDVLSGWVPAAASGSGLAVARLGGAAYRAPAPRSQQHWITQQRPGGRGAASGPSAGRWGGLSLSGTTSAAAAAAAVAQLQAQLSAPAVVAIVPEELTAPARSGGGPGMIPVEPCGRAGAAVLADSQAIWGKLPGPPLFHPSSEVDAPAFAAASEAAAAAPLPLPDADEPKLMPSIETYAEADVAADVPIAVAAAGGSALAPATTDPPSNRVPFRTTAGRPVPLSIPVQHPVDVAVAIPSGGGGAAAPVAEWSVTPAFQACPLPDLCPSGFDIDEWHTLGGSA